ncbi:MAG TPA: molybdopterin-binding protein [Nitrososphaerales archaeon]|nr:molybdopterin-binding protein [Nitrososphaerales archaeon]
MKKDPASVEIIIVGNELLNGTTLDTNSQWLSKRLQSLGASVTRKTTVRDNLQEISQAFQSAMKRSPAWIFSVGGLGPTFDDMTLRGLAISLRRKICRNLTAVQMIRKSREERIHSGTRISRSLLPATLKMAEMPVGAVPLVNTVGTAPGVLVKVRFTRIVSLPGVPKEVKAIFLQEVRPLLRMAPMGTKREEKWLHAEGISESSIAPKISKLMRKYAPSIYIKSHPIGFRKGVSILKFQLSIEGGSQKNEKILDLATNELISESKKMGAKVRMQS